MTPEAQNIAIAEACGAVAVLPATKPNERYMVRWPDADWPNGDWVLGPDYTADLNAMCEAEAMLSPEQWNEYGAILAWVAKWSPENPRAVWSATAAHRAEAFLRTLKLWKD